MGVYTSTVDLQNRLSAAVVLRIADDDNNGTADASVLESIIRDGESKFEGACRGIYDLQALRSQCPNEAKRICLDIEEAIFCKRFPRAANREWLPLWQAAETELKALRRRDTALDIETSPEPAATEGGNVYQYGDDVTTLGPTSFFQGGTGHF